MGRQEADESDLLLRTLQGSSEKDIEEMLASPPALCIQNDAVCSGKSVAWHSQWTRSQRIRILSIAFVASLLSLSSFFAYYPCIMALKTDFNHEHSQIFPFVSYMGLFIWAVTGVVWRKLSDRYSRKWMHSLSLFLFMLSSYAVSIAWSMWGFAAFFLLLCVCASGIPAIAMGIVFEILPHSSRGMAAGSFLSLSVISIIVGPLVAGLIAEAGWRYVYLSIALGGTVMFIVHLVLVPETRDEVAKERRLLGSVGLETGEFISVTLLISLVTGLLYLIYLTIGILFPYRYSTQIKDPFAVGIVYFIMGISTAVGAGVGTLISYLLRKKFDIGGHLIMPVVVLIMLSFGSLLLGWSLEQATQAGVPVAVVVICGLVRGSVIPGLISYCIEIQPMSAERIIERLTFSQLLFGGIFQLAGTLLETALSSYPLSFVIIAFLMIIGCLPVLIYLFQRLAQSYKENLNLV